MTHAAPAPGVMRQCMGQVLGMQEGCQGRSGPAAGHLSHVSMVLVGARFRLSPFMSTPRWSGLLPLWHVGSLSAVRWAVLLGRRLDLRAKEELSARAEAVGQSAVAQKTKSYLNLKMLSDNDGSKEERAIEDSSWKPKGWARSEPNFSLSEPGNVRHRGGSPLGVPAVSCQERP